MLILIIILGVVILPEEYLLSYGIFIITYMLSSLIYNNYIKRSFALYEKDFQVSQKRKGYDDKVIKNKGYHIYLNTDSDSIFTKIFTMHIAKSHRDFEISKKFYDDLSYDMKVKYNIAYINKMINCYQSKEGWYRNWLDFRGYSSLVFSFCKKVVISYNSYCEQ